MRSLLKSFLLLLLYILFALGAKEKAMEAESSVDHRGATSTFTHIVSGKIENGWDTKMRNTATHLRDTLMLNVKK
ncbi:hypothetical protein U1E44_13990 [Arenibacter sp. GZD96]|uniref:hypothetical protein n=1 Tax=Aurantibrevibacter litoralis TaxID=3106030 RepID=UPI002AFF29B9|nr:hypothetical protein [Arenibacter sp. GZD-96]MEA1787208.1 hypothetical protein [Arenibacter sp. GZD-96]